jgi:hypothetical protein
MNEAKSQPWYQLYASAVVELDAKQLIKRVNETEAAFTVVYGICSTTATIMRNGNS